MAVTYKFLQELPSKRKIQCIYTVQLSFNFGWHTISLILFVKNKGRWFLCKICQVRQNLFVDGLNVIIPFKIKIIAPRPFQLQREVWKFYDICVRWKSPKNDLQRNFSNIENWSLGYRSHFFSFYIFDIRLPVNLFTSLIGLKNIYQKTSIRRKQV